MTNPPQLRIGYLVSKYPAVSHTFILREAAALRERGIAIDVASINDPPPRNELTEIERSEADRTFYVKRQGAIGALKAAAWMAVHYPAGLFRGLRVALQLAGWDLARIVLCCFYLAEAAILAKWLHQRGLTHLHVHFATPAATVGLVLTHIAPVTLSITVHGPDEFYDVTDYYLAQKIEAARFVICISFFAQSQLMKLSPSKDWHKFDLARLGVDCAHFTPRPLPSSSGPCQIVCVGRLVSTKGQHILIMAVERLIRAGRRIQLRFVGDGPHRRELEEMVRDRGLSGNILFQGAVNQDRIQTYYDEADIFALASFAEGIPVVLMEAMAMEIPCVASSINGIPELIQDGVEGLLVPPSDIEGLARALARLMDDPALRESLGKAGRQRVLASYELSKSADHLADVFRRRLEPTQ